MDSELVRILCALAAFVLPLTLAWAVVMLGERRRKLREHACGGESGKPAKEAS